MASKEATIYILDVGPSLKAKREGSDVSRLEETKKVLLKLLANKVLFSFFFAACTLGVAVVKRT